MNLILKKKEILRTIMAEEQLVKRYKQMSFSISQQSKVYDTPFKLIKIVHGTAFSETKFEEQTIWLDTKMLYRYSEMWRVLTSTTTPDSDPMIIPCGDFNTWKLLMKLFENNLNSQCISENAVFDGADVIRTLEWLQVDPAKITSLFQSFWDNENIKGTWILLPTRYAEMAKEQFKKHLPTITLTNIVIQCFPSEVASLVVDKFPRMSRLKLSRVELPRFGGFN